MNTTPYEPKLLLSRRRRDKESGQAFVEFSIVLLMLTILVFGLIDFSWAIYEKQLLVNLSREGANLAARGSGTTTLEIMSNALDAVVTSASPLSFTSSSGLVILTAVTNNGSGGYFVSKQIKSGTLSASSKVGTTIGGTALLPSESPPILQAGHTVYTAEIYYKFTPRTPIGKLIKATLPTSFYDVAYFPGG